MPIIVALRVKCDAFEDLGKLRRRCNEADDFEATNIKAARDEAERADWCFDTTGEKDKAFCPKHGRKLKPHLYPKKS